MEWTDAVREVGALPFLEDYTLSSEQFFVSGEFLHDHHLSLDILYKDEQRKWVGIEAIRTYSELWEVIRHDARCDGYWCKSSPLHSA